MSEKGFLILMGLLIGGLCFHSCVVNASETNRGVWAAYLNEGELAETFSGTYYSQQKVSENSDSALVVALKSDGNKLAMAVGFILGELSAYDKVEVYLQLGKGGELKQYTVVKGKPLTLELHEGITEALKKGSISVLVMPFIDDKMVDEGLLSIEKEGKSDGE